jgi:hypothetical protein
MPPTNGFESDAPPWDRLISLVARFNALADGWDRRLDFLEQQAGTGFESVRKEVREEIGKVRDDLDDLRELVVRVQVELGIVREDTNPRMRLPPAHEVQSPKGEDGAIVATARLVEKVPAPLRSTLFKLALSLAGGGALTELWHRLTGH